MLFSERPSSRSRCQRRVSPRTVYDAGKALRQNFTENATPANPYTDENGGK